MCSNTHAQRVCWDGSWACVWSADFGCSLLLKAHMHSASTLPCYPSFTSRSGSLFSFLKLFSSYFPKFFDIFRSFFISPSIIFFCGYFLLPGWRWRCSTRTSSLLTPFSSTTALNTSSSPPSLYSLLSLFSPFPLFILLSFFLLSLTLFFLFSLNAGHCVAHGHRWVLDWMVALPWYVFPSLFFSLPSLLLSHTDIHFFH